MTEARWRQSGAGAGWPLLAEACWLAPLRAGRPRGRRLRLVPPRTVATLLRLERQGRHHEIVAQRKQLKALSETLFAIYMRTR